MAGISDLLEALKRTESKMKSGIKPKDAPKGEVSITMIDGKPMEPEMDDMPHEEAMPDSHHAEIVNALKEHFPEVHAEILKKVGGGNDGFGAH